MLSHANVAYPIITDNSQDHDLEKLIIDLVLKNEIQTLLTFLHMAQQKKLALHKINYNGMSLLLLAVMNHSLPMVKQLIQFGAYDPLSASQDLFHHPIVQAAEACLWDIVGELATIPARSQQEKEAYGYALFLVMQYATQTELPIARVLLQSAACPNQKLKDSLSGNTILHLAIERNLSELIPLIIKSGGNLHASNALGMTPILYAIHKQKPDCLSAFSELNHQVPVKKTVTGTLTNLSDNAIHELTSKCADYFGLKLLKNILKNPFKPLPADLLDEFASREGNKELLRQALHAIPGETYNNLYWLALCPASAIGELYFLQRGPGKPWYQGGHLFYICHYLSSKSNLPLFPDVASYLVSHFESIQSLDSELKKTICTSYLKQVLFPTLIADPFQRGENNAALLKYLSRHKEMVLRLIYQLPHRDRQKLLWSAMATTTWLGKIFHTKRGLAPPDIRYGTLGQILRLLDLELLDDNTAFRLSKDAKLMAQLAHSNATDMVTLRIAQIDSRLKNAALLQSLQLKTPIEMPHPISLPAINIKPVIQTAAAVASSTNTDAFTQLYASMHTEKNRDKSIESFLPLMNSTQTFFNEASTKAILARTIEKNSIKKTITESQQKSILLI